MASSVCSTFRRWASDKSLWRGLFIQQDGEPPVPGQSWKRNAISSKFFIQGHYKPFGDAGTRAVNSFGYLIANRLQITVPGKIGSLGLFSLEGIRQFKMAVYSHDFDIDLPYDLLAYTEEGQLQGNQHVELEVVESVGISVGYVWVVALYEEVSVTSKIRQDLRDKRTDKKVAAPWLWEKAFPSHFPVDSDSLQVLVDRYNYFIRYKAPEGCFSEMDKHNQIVTVEDVLAFQKETKRTDSIVYTS
jgi:hypothetical protein